MFLILLTVFFLGFSTPVHSRGTGAPVEACTKLVPNPTAEGHGVGPQDPTTTEFDFTVDKGLNPGAYVVTLKGKDPATKIKGFLLAAKKSEDKDKDDAELQGTWGIDAASMQERDCPKGGGKFVTHINPNEKDSVVLSWTPPAAGGKFVFFGVAVKEMIMYWQHMRDLDTPGSNDSSTDATASDDPADEGCGSIFASAFIILLMLGIQLVNSYK